MRQVQCLDDGHLRHSTPGLVLRQCPAVQLSCDRSSSAIVVGPSRKYSCRAFGCNQLRCTNTQSLAQSQITSRHKRSRMILFSSPVVSFSKRLTVFISRSLNNDRLLAASRTRASEPALLFKVPVRTALPCIIYSGLLARNSNMLLVSFPGVRTSRLNCHTG